MIVAPFDEAPSSQSLLPVRPESADRQPSDDGRKERAVAQLLERGVLSHAFGQHGEYKVRTTLTTRQTWQYRCYVLRHGKPFKGGFFPIIVEYKPAQQRVMPKHLSTDATQDSFAQEAVDVHFTRCAALGEYLVLSALYDQPPSPSRRWFILLAPLAGIAMAVAFGAWAHIFPSDSGQPLRNPSPPIADQRPTREGWGAPLLNAGSPPSRADMNAPAGAASQIDSREALKTVSVSELVTQHGPPPKADKAPRTLPAVDPPGPPGSDLQAGDVVVVTGWLHRISRGTDGTYRLHMSASRNTEARALTAMVPPAVQAPDLPTVQAQVQEVRAFIKQQLLRQKEPSLRGSVMQRPIFVQLTGQVANPASSSGTPAQKKRAQEATAHWEIRRVLEIQFATPSEASERSRSQ
jgi:hypothetical protein